MTVLKIWQVENNNRCHCFKNSKGGLLWANKYSTFSGVLLDSHKNMTVILSFMKCVVCYWINFRNVEKCAEVYPLPFNSSTRCLKLYVATIDLSLSRKLSRVSSRKGYGWYLSGSVWRTNVPASSNVKPSTTCRFLSWLMTVIGMASSVISVTGFPSGSTRTEQTRKSSVNSHHFSKQRKSFTI